MTRLYTTIFGVIAALIALIYGGLSLYDKGYAAAEALYQKKAVQAAMYKIKNTETLEAQKEQLKKREVNLDADCKAIYNTNLSACRRQLRGQR